MDSLVLSYGIGFGVSKLKPWNVGIQAKSYRKCQIQINSSKSRVLLSVIVVAALFKKRGNFPIRKSGCILVMGFIQEGLIFGEIHCRHA